jgi:Questin oxidase-like
MPHETLHRLLDENLLLPDEYADGLTNHLPMALHALDRLGADAARLREFARDYAQRLGPPRPNACAVAPLIDWRRHRGDYTSLPALRSTFAEALRREAPADVLRQAVPHLISGAGGAAFHGLLRTAHAYESTHVGELAGGLAYWAARWLPLAPEQAARQPLGFEAWSAQLMNEASGWVARGARISQRMEAAAHAAPYRALAGSLALDENTLGRLSGLAAARYAETGNFTVLHLVTGCRVARVLLPFAGEASAALGAVVRAFTAAWLASGAAADAHRASSSAPADWPALVAFARRSQDEHVVKLIDACIEEERCYGTEAYRRAATRRLGADGP